MRKSLRQFRVEAAFSLVEMLVVVAIIIVLMGLLVPSVSSLLSASNMDQGAKTVFDQFALARQLASTSNNIIEVRLVNIKNMSDQGYSGIQLFVSGTNITPIPAGKIVYLPQAIVIANSPQLSRFLSYLTVSGTMQVAGAARDYVSFSIRPSGAVVPVETGTDRNNLYVTVVPARFASSSTMPPNFGTIQLNPDTGSPLFFRR